MKFTKSTNKMCTFHLSLWIQQLKLKLIYLTDQSHTWTRAHTETHTERESEQLNNDASIRNWIRLNDTHMEKKGIIKYN